MKNNEQMPLEFRKRKVMVIAKKTDHMNHSKRKFVEKGKMYKAVKTSDGYNVETLVSSDHWFPKHYFDEYFVIVDDNILPGWLFEI